MPVFPYNGRPKSLGVAVRVFPVLKRWGLKTRDIPLYPIGYKASQTTLDKLGKVERQKCVLMNARSLYHDLGVVAFDGCTYKQTQQIGQILADTIALGGPAGLVAKSGGGGGFRKMPGRLHLPSTFPDGDEGRPFDFTSSIEHLRQAAVSHLRDHLRRNVPQSSAEVEFVEKKSTIAIPADRPSPFHDTANERRLLPVDVYWRIRPVKGDNSNNDDDDSLHVKIDMGLYSTGAGISLGTVSLMYNVRFRAVTSRDEDGGEMCKAESSLAAYVAEQGFIKGAGGLPESCHAKVAALDAFLGLWELERQTWAGRAGEIPQGGGGGGSEEQVASFTLYGGSTAEIRAGEQTWHKRLR